MVLAFVYFLFCQWNFVMPALLFIEALLLFMLFLPYWYMFFSKRKGWHLIPDIKNPFFSKLSSVVIILGLLPTIFYYYIMCDQAIAWKTHKYNGGSLDSEMSAFVAIMAMLWIILCFIGYTILAFVAYCSRKNNRQNQSNESCNVPEQ